jgi:hypothetical protein
MGIRPSGLGLRLMSLQFQPELALAGERWPFDAFALPFVGSCAGEAAVPLCVALLAAISPAGLRDLREDLLLDLALPMSLLESSSISSSIAAWADALIFLADLVVGPKYPSCNSSFTSEGVGDGEMTLGVAGTEADEWGMLKGCRQGVRITPV